MKKEKRKVVKQGPSTMMISLPSSWVKQNKIEKGDELFVEQQNKELIIKCVKNKKEQEITLNLTKIKSSTLLHYIIINHYLKGNKRIEIKYIHDSKTTVFYQKKEMNTAILIERLVSDLIGLEIIEDKEGFCVLEEITDIDASSEDHTLRRALLLLNQFTDYIINSLKSEKKKYLEPLTEEAIKLHSVDKFFKYTIKLINNGELSKEEIQRKILLINDFQLIIHLYANLSLIKNVREDLISNLTTISNILKKVTSHIFKTNINKLEQIIEQINSLQIELTENHNNVILLNLLTTIKFSIRHLKLI